MQKKQSLNSLNGARASDNKMSGSEIGATA